MLRRGQGYYNKSNKNNAIYFVPGYDLLFHYPIEEVFLPLPQNIFPEVKDTLDDLEGITPEERQNGLDVMIKLALESAIKL